MKNDLSLYEQTVATTADYLGPAARRFVDRQIYYHLDKNPSSLTKQDLKKLIDWLRVSLAVITNDLNLIDEYILRLEQFIKNNQSIIK